MRRYESIFITDANLSNDELNALIERYKAIITELKGIVVKIEEWGKRKLAYEIKKHSRGNYILIDFAVDTDITTELERNFKIDDKILKFLTVKKDDNVDIKEIEKEIISTENDIKHDDIPSSPVEQPIASKDKIDNQKIAAGHNQGKEEESTSTES